MALSASTVWEVRTTGSDTNGGGYVSGGTDWSQQDAAQYSVTDAVTAGTTTITSATANFGTDVVGNILYIQGGTGSITAGWYQITSRTNATTIVVDRSTGLTTGTGATLKIGGALASLGQCCGAAASGNQVWIKAGTYTLTSTTSNVSAGRITQVSGTGNTGVAKTQAYTTTRGDDTGFATMLAGVGFTSATIFTGGADCVVRGLVFDGASRTSVRPYSSTNGNGRVERCTAQNGTNGGFYAANSIQLVNCIATGCSGNTAAFFGDNAACHLFGCVSYDNTNCGYYLDNQCLALFCLAYRNSGASSDGFQLAAIGTSIMSCTSYSNGRDGIRFAGANGGSVINCIATNNGGWGIYAGSAFGATVAYNCATYTNTSGGVSTNVGATANNVALSAGPFTSVSTSTAGAADFSLNTTSGGGAACRAVGIPGAFPGGLTTGYLDIGAVQHADPAGGGTKAYVFGA